MKLRFNILGGTLGQSGTCSGNTLWEWHLFLSSLYSWHRGSTIPKRRPYFKNKTLFFWALPEIRPSLIKAWQEVRPDVFTPSFFYDGFKALFLGIFYPLCQGYKAACVGTNTVAALKQQPLFRYPLILPVNNTLCHSVRLPFAFYHIHIYTLPCARLWFAFHRLCHRTAAGNAVTTGYSYMGGSTHGTGVTR